MGVPFRTVHSILDPKVPGLFAVTVPSGKSIQPFMVAVKKQDCLCPQCRTGCERAVWMSVLFLVWEEELGSLCSCRPIFGSEIKRSNRAKDWWISLRANKTSPRSERLVHSEQNLKISPRSSMT